MKNKLCAQDWNFFCPQSIHTMKKNAPANLKTYDFKLFVTFAALNQNHHGKFSSNYRSSERREIDPV